MKAAGNILVLYKTIWNISVHLLSSKIPFSKNRLSHFSSIWIFLTNRSVHQPLHYLIQLLTKRSTSRMITRALILIESSLGVPLQHLCRKPVKIASFISDTDLFKVHSFWLKVNKVEKIRRLVTSIGIRYSNNINRSADTCKKSKMFYIKTRMIR